MFTKRVHSLCVMLNDLYHPSKHVIDGERYLNWHRPLCIYRCYNEVVMQEYQGTFRWWKWPPLTKTTTFGCWYRRKWWDTTSARFIRWSHKTRVALSHRIWMTMWMGQSWSLWGRIHGRRKETFCTLQCSIIRFWTYLSTLNVQWG